MRRRWVALSLLAVAAIGTAAVVAVVRPWGRPAPASTSALPPLTLKGPFVFHSSGGAKVDIVAVNDSGRACTLRINGSAALLNVASLESKLPAVDSGTHPVLQTNGPFTLNWVEIEYDGKAVRRDHKVTVPAGETYEIHVEKDDTIRGRIVEK